jgi:hypothetical protein
VILLHRLTPFAIALLTALLFVMLITAPRAFLPFEILAFLLIPLLFSRLLLFEVRRPAFWVFLGTPFVLLVSALAFFLLLDPGTGKWFMAGVVTLSLALYAENVFAFYHLPSTYQAYSLEYLTLIMYVMSAFFFTSFAYMAQLFLELPLWTPAVAVFVAVLFATMAVFWVSKIGFETGIPYAVVGAILMTQMYVTLALLPTSFITNAAVFAVCLSTYFGLVRAQVLDKLTPNVVRRYVGLCFILLLLILGTATWV